MRMIVNAGGLFVVLTILILIHTSLINKNLRDAEVSSGLESAADYAMDVMGDMYKTTIYDETKVPEYRAALVAKFCESLDSVIGTDGDISVLVKEADVKNGVFAFTVTEEYKYTFKARKGVTRCERAAVFK